MTLRTEDGQDSGHLQRVAHPEAQQAGSDAHAGAWLNDWLIGGHPA